MKFNRTLRFGSIILGICLTIYFSATPDKSFDELKPLYVNDASSFMEINGIKIHYRDEGEGFPIVLIHGTGSSLHTWDEWVKLLKNNYRVIRLDLPAYGLTGQDPLKRYTSLDYVTLLDEFLNQLGVNAFHLAGNSLGGQVSWLYAANHSNKVNKLVLIDPSGFPFDQTPNIVLLAKTPGLNLFARYFTPRFFVEQNLREVYFDNTRLEETTIDRYRDLTLLEGNRQAFIDRAFIERENHTDQLPKIKSPTLVLWGEEDEWIPVSDAEKFRAVIMDSKVVIMPETGHVPMEERPHESLAIFLEFIQS